MGDGAGLTEAGRDQPPAGARKQLAGDSLVRMSARSCSLSSELWRLRSNCGEADVAAGSMVAFLGLESLSVRNPCGPVLHTGWCWRPSSMKLIQGICQLAKAVDSVHDAA